MYIKQVKELIKIANDHELTQVVKEGIVVIKQLFVTEK